MGTADDSRTAATDCDHLWVRRRDGSRCAYCDQLRLGVSLSEAEHERLQSMRAALENPPPATFPHQPVVITPEEWRAALELERERVRMLLVFIQQLLAQHDPPTR